MSQWNMLYTLDLMRVYTSRVNEFPLHIIKLPANYLS